MRRFVLISATLLLAGSALGQTIPEEQKALADAQRAAAAATRRSEQLEMAAANTMDAADKTRAEAAAIAARTAVPV